MSLLPLLPSGGIAYPGFSRLEDISLRIFHPQLPTEILYDIVDDDFRNGWLPFPNSPFAIGIAVKSLISSYSLSGGEMTIVTNEDWASPLIPPGAFVEFRAKIPETWTASKQPAWVQNAAGIGQKLLFSGRIEDVQHLAEAESGTGMTYVCRSAAHYSRFIAVNTSINGTKLPRRSYNIDGTENQNGYKRCIKKAGSLQDGGLYDYPPYGYSGIAGPTSTHPTIGMPENTNDNLKLTVGEMIIDMFGSHGVDLKLERVVPGNWDPYQGAGTLPYVQAELDDLDFVPDSVFLGQTNFYDAIFQIIRRHYPNYSVWVDRLNIWHFTPISDNLDDSASTEEEIFDPSSWLVTRLGVISILFATPTPASDETQRKVGELVYGRLIRGDVRNTIADRYTAVRIVGYEITETSEESLQSGGLLASWGQQNASRQTTLQTGFVGAGPQTSTHRHYDTGDHGWGIPVYKVADAGGGNITITIRGFMSLLWPHTDHEWIGTTCLVSFAGLLEVKANTYKWFDDAQGYSIIACANVADIGNGTPGYTVTIDAGGLDIGVFKTEFDDSAQVAARIQLSDDFGLASTFNINQLSATYREFTISETTTSHGNALINSSPANPCNVRVLVNNAALRPTPPAGAVGGRPQNLLEFGQSLGQTSANFAGRLHMKGQGGSFWFGGSLIIPFAALKQGRERATQEANAAAFSEACRRSRSIIAPQVKVIFDKSTETFREVRVPALDGGGVATFAGTAAIWSGVKRELVVQADRFIDESQELEFKKLATAILRTVSDLEPTGEGWEFIEVPRFLSLIDLHFRLDVDWYRTFGLGGGSPYGIKQAVVTQISYNFESDNVTLSLDSKHNPFAGYDQNSLSELLIDAKRYQSILDDRAKEERERQCRRSYQTANPTTNEAPINPRCESTISRDRGAGRGKPAPPPCHVLGSGLVESAMGAMVAPAGGSSGGYASGTYDAEANLSAGMGWTALPFFDSLGRLFFWDNFGSFFRGLEGGIVEGEPEQSAIVGAPSDPGWTQTPTVSGEGEAPQTLGQIGTGIKGYTAETPAPSIYNHIKSYVPGTGVITLMYDNLQAGLYTNGMVHASNGPDALQPVYILSHTQSTITLKLPAGPGYPTAAQFEAGTHIFITAQKKPLADSTMPEGTRLFKDANGDWFGVEPDGDFRAVTITNPTDYVPNAADNGAGSPVFTAYPVALATPVISKSGNYTILSTDHTVLVDSSSAAVTITLPDPSTNEGQQFEVSKEDGSVNTVTLDVSGGGSINGSTTATLTSKYDVVTVRSISSEYRIV